MDRGSLRSAKQWLTAEWLLRAFVAGCACLMYIHAFFGTEITDEAYYISDALAMLQGNLPFAYNNYSYGSCAAFLLIPQLFVYDLLVPSHAGIVLFTRLSFVTFRLLMLYGTYRVLCRSFRRTDVLLALAFLVPYHAGPIDNYSYNTIPALLMLPIAALVYDALEHTDRCCAGRFFLCGFLSGIAVFAHMGYGLAVPVFLVLAVCRAKRERRLACALAYMAGGVTEILVAVVPVAVRTGWATLWRGIDLRIFHPYPTMQMEAVTAGEKLLELWAESKPLLAVGLAAFAAARCGAALWVRKRAKTLSAQEQTMFSFALALLCAFVWLLRTCGGMGSVYQVGVLAFWCALFALPVLRKKAAFLYYIGIYPLLFSLGLVVLVDSSASVSRFAAAIPVLAAVFLALLAAEWRPTRVMAVVSVVVCTFLLGFGTYSYVYRDDSMWKLDCRVESGVYQGLYTTESRANDLPELEEYLNTVVSQDEYYCFRDNVPCGYLMVRQGQMCESATWDIMQYSYGLNTPAPLFDYYMRRGTVPDKIIYVDFGRDDHLSIEDENFRYNDFVNAYYELVEEVALNGTFRRVLVYQYNGTFDGDFSCWIDTYRELP